MVMGLGLSKVCQTDGELGIHGVSSGKCFRGDHAREWVIGGRRDVVRNCYVTVLKYFTITLSTSLTITIKSGPTKPCCGGMNGCVLSSRLYLHRLI